MGIEDIRKEIDRIDAEMAELFVRRMKASERIAEYKAQNGAPVFDKEREKRIIENGCRRVPEQIETYYREFISGVIGLSKDLQKSLIALDSDDAVYCPAGRYNIYAGEGTVERHIAEFDLARRVLILTEDGVPGAYPREIADYVTQSGGIPFTFCLDGGEICKNIGSVSDIVTFMLENSFSRNDCLVSVGGGSVSDIAGLVSSVYMRGIDYYLIPTTLLAQIDASVGGKNGVNSDGVKNVIGTFSSPLGVIADRKYLDTLTQCEISCGAAELIKIAAVLDAELFEEFDGTVTDRQIRRAVELKVDVVNCDFRDRTLRRVLNFGHTLGHGIEITSGYGHGQAVALGMLAMSDGTARERISEKIRLFGLPETGIFDTEKVMNAVMHDKKGTGEKTSCITCPEIGSFAFAEYGAAELSERLKSVLNEA
ncbi:MAG: iron-containing alcohol dehydrogenase [Clostridia bacterium]|nr:iron-containing alcohol dehydrogenase [Clostridia bacterium]